ncbi:MAG: YitT family protein [Butyricicoccaceae bacterium]
MKKIQTRLLMYFGGLFLMTIGIAISVKSNLGVSPVSSIPYTMTCVWGIEMGRATILFHAVLVLIQILILRRNFALKNLFQVLIGVVFGMFTTFCNYCVSFLPTPNLLPVQLMMMLISTVVIAFGIFLYVPADIIPLAGEGTMKAVSDTTGTDFSKVKIAFDVSMVAISLVTCLVALHSFGSVGIGTVIAAVLVGAVHGQFVKAFGGRRDALLA